MTVNHQYAFTPYCAALFVELYLPKRSEYQGVLYDTLTRGFNKGPNVGAVERHFHDLEIRARLLEFLGDYYRERLEAQYETIEAALEKPRVVSLGGYSMYEVDGVFWSNCENRPIEERTQVLRLLFPFVPDELDGMGNLSPKLSQLAHHYLSASRFVQGELISEGDESTRDMLNVVERWFVDVGLFVFGYLVFTLCEEIRFASKPEEQIWVTSLKNLNVNVIPLEKSPVANSGHNR